MEYETNEKKKLKLVDIPGNDRIRKSELEKYKVSRVFLRNIWLTDISEVFVESSLSWILKRFQMR